MAEILVWVTTAVHGPAIGYAIVFINSSALLEHHFSAAAETFKDQYTVAGCVAVRSGLCLMPQAGKVQ